MEQYLTASSAVFYQSRNTKEDAAIENLAFVKEEEEEEEEKEEK